MSRDFQMLRCAHGKYRRVNVRGCPDGTGRDVAVCVVRVLTNGKKLSATCREDSSPLSI